MSPAVPGLREAVDEDDRVAVAVVGVGRGVDVVQASVRRDERGVVDPRRGLSVEGGHASQS